MSTRTRGSGQNDTISRTLETTSGARARAAPEGERPPRHAPTARFESWLLPKHVAATRAMSMAAMQRRVSSAMDVRLIPPTLQSV